MHQNTLKSKWHMPEKLDAASGPPKALKGALKLDLD